MLESSLILCKAAVLRAAAEPAPFIPDLVNRPVFFLGPLSLLGHMHGEAIASRLKQPVAVIDDVSVAEEIYGIPRWTTSEFLARARNYPNAVALDFSSARWTRVMFAAICSEAQIELQDCVLAQAQFDLPAVYETVNVYRQKTLDKLDDFMRLAERFEDDLSRQTLYANLLFRLTFNRGALLQAWSDSAEEYFSPLAQPSTFRLGTREHYCDCGAFQGPIIRKFLGVTGWKYASIAAFEPDKKNYEVLSTLSALPISNMRLINKAVSSRRQTLRFLETGTVSSYVSAGGNVVVETTRLDDELEHLSFLKMDVEGFEAKTLQGAARLLASERPRIAACVYHYAHDLLNVVDTIDKLAGDYHYRLRQHNPGYYYDLVLYASPLQHLEPHARAA
jgi:FkbM family methyltransferase